MKRAILIGFFLFAINQIMAQCGGPPPPPLSFINPSFEGPSCAGCQPGPWVDCGGTPDTQPGQWGFTQAPSDGNSYVSFLQSGSSAGGYYEGSSQQLSSCMIAGQVYSFSVDLAHSAVYNTAVPGNCYSSFEIWGTNGLCGQSELLWQSGPITNTSWQTFNITLIPTSAWCYVTFRPYWISNCSGYVNVMVDNLGPMLPIVPTLQMNVNADISCTQTITGEGDCPMDSLIMSGNFIGSPMSATLLTDSTFQETLSYPPNSLGSQTIFVTAYFQTGGSANDSVTFNLVDVITDFTAPNVCYGNPSIFTDITTISSGSIVTWDWDFGDSFTSTAQSPTHTYANTGIYNVTLITITDLGCFDTIIKPVEVYEIPNAAFTSNSVCLNFNTNFTDQSTIGSGVVNNWNWDFGDGNSSTAQNPAHPYASAGTFNVKLVVTSDNGCSDSITQSTIVHALPVADFFFTDGCVYETVSFSDLSIVAGGPITGWDWDFGDASASAIQNPTHLYTNPGTYVVELIATSSFGCKDTITQNTVRHPKPAAAFSSTTVCLNSPTSFTDLSTISTGNILQWNWSFGDGTGASVQQNPAYTYGTDGFFTTQLIVTSDNSCIDTVTNQVEVYPLPQPSFYTDTVCINTPPTQFTNTSAISSGSIVSYQWDLGSGGATSVQTNPSFTYPADGTYSIELLATSANGCSDSVTQTVIVHPKPTADFLFTNDCVQNTATFTDQSTITSGSVTGWNWDFGDGTAGSIAQNPSNFYLTPGFYNVTLIATSAFGCKDTIIKATQRYATPAADFSPIDVCLNDTTYFTDLSTVANDFITQWAWDFGDGGTSTQQNPGHLFTLGTFNVNLQVTSSNGCMHDTTQMVSVFPIPMPAFTSTPVCLNEPPTVFTDQSTIISPDIIVDWQWDFGDDSTSSGQSQTHAYASDGLFTVQLIVTSNNNCTDSITQQAEVYSLPQPAFISDNTALCQPACINFFDLSTASSSIISWEWDFGDGNGSSQQHPQNCYQYDGTYSITLIPTSSDNCKDTLVNVEMITIWPKPVAGFQTVPEEASIFLPEIFCNDLSSGAISWHWDFGDKTTDTVNQFPEHVYADTGMYTIEQIVITEYGCTDTAYSTVYIFPEFAVFIPNAFTPNDDGFNDIFMQNGYGIVDKDFDLLIFDRWGDIVFENHNLGKGWDGTVGNSGKEAQQGVYVYRINLTDVVENRKHSFSGHVSLIR
ncbi:MAG: hypothetical protein COA57_09400 [Flavobacteriales bacterium]|nr:MAG: hypothetical protein COA57_09400 [Flavobacteriales bacterium]